MTMKMGEIARVVTKIGKTKVTRQPHQIKLEVNTRRKKTKQGDAKC